MAHICPWWLAYTFDNRLRRLIHRPEKLVNPYVAAGMTVLDLGCGMGVFSVAMARLVGDEGLVISVDLQDEMLERVRRRAQKAGVDRRIRIHRCQRDRIGDHRDVNFALAFWMVHEVDRVRIFLDQVKACLAPEALFLMVEPKFHVSARSFQGLGKEAEKAGFKPCPPPRILFSRAALFCHPA